MTTSGSESVWLVKRKQLTKVDITESKAQSKPEHLWGLDV